MAATGIAVSSGVVSDALGGSASASLASALASHQDSRPSVDLGDRAVHEPSRSHQRAPIDPAKELELSQDSGGQATRTEDLADGDPREIAKILLPEFGFSVGQFGCLDALYDSESDWDVHADNPLSSAYGIPQALPGSKMAAAGPDWEDNAVTQIRWGLEYIQSRYGTPCSAWSFKQSHNWY